MMTTLSFKVPKWSCRERETKVSMIYALSQDSDVLIDAVTKAFRNDDSWGSGNYNSNGW